MSTDTTKTIVINLKDNLQLRFPAKYDSASSEWVIRFQDETFTDLTTYCNNGKYAFDESSNIRIE